MSKWYVISNLTVKNWSFLTNYATKVDAALLPYNGKFLVRGGNIHYEENKQRNVNVVIEFPSVEKMNTWFNSEAYQKIISTLRSTCEGEFIMIEGCSYCIQGIV